MCPVHRQRELEFTMACLLHPQCIATNIRRLIASHATASAGQHVFSSGDLPPTCPQNMHCLIRHLPKQHAKVTRYAASTHQPIPQYNAQPMLLRSRQALSERSHRTAPSIQRHFPQLQSTRQCPSTHNALHSHPSNNSRPDQFKPCHANAPHHRRVNTKPNPEPPLPLPKLSTPASCVLCTGNAN